MGEALVGGKAAAEQQRVFQADGGRLSEGGPDGKFIVLLQKAPVNDVEYLFLVVDPVDLREHGGDGAELAAKPICGGNVIAAFQRSLRYSQIAVVNLPLPDLAGVLPSAGVRNIKDIPQPGRAAGRVKKRDAPGAAPHIPAHNAVPDVIGGAGGRVRPLGVNHELVVIGVLV